MTLRFAATTHRGLVRPRNEDNYLVLNLTKSSSARDGTSVAVAGIAARNDTLLLLVADGLGGQSRGDLASQTVVERFARYADNSFPPAIGSSRGAERIRAWLAHELKQCHAELRRKSNIYPELRGMGSTATVAVVAWPKLFVAHVGDSRCYLLRDGKSHQLTRDHSVAQYLVDQGAMKASLGGTSPFRHQLWNALGGDVEDVIVDFHDVDLRANDALLLCTDGLSNRLSDAQLVDHLQSDAGAAETCGGLVAAANTAGGQDNITCCVVRFGAGTTPSSALGCCQSFASQSGNAIAR